MRTGPRPSRIASTPSAKSSFQSRDQARSSAATLGYKFVTAPIEGEIGNLDSVKLGDVVRQGQAITGIVHNSSLWTLMDVPATQPNTVLVKAEFRNLPGMLARETWFCTFT